MVLVDKWVILEHLQPYIRCNSNLLNLQALHSHQQTHCLLNRRIDYTMTLTMASIIQTTITAGVHSLLIQNKLNITPGDGSARRTSVYLLNSLMRWKQTLEFSTMTSLALSSNSYHHQRIIEMNRASLTGNGLMQ